MATGGLDDVIGTYAEMTKDFRAMLRQVVVDGLYYRVVAPVDGRKVAVLRVSLYDEDVDGTTLAFPVSSRDLASDTAFHLNAVRFLLVPLRIMIRGRPKYMVEPGESVIRWVRTRLGVESYGIYLDAILAGRLGTRLIEPFEKRRARAEDARDSEKKKVVRLQKRHEELVRQRMAAERRSSESLGQAAVAKDAQGEIARMKAALEQKVRDQDTMIRHLRQQLIEHHIEPRPYEPPMAYGGSAYR